ncbi:hypothetical protein [Sphingopyxis sp. H115]|uniref:hypothetical protein n=1 Tax=Sphingopyxis sp. H115 TaxID=1759073 RepID=UPI0013663F28|nr:hypothetical protein [Sphingopyxis sp. H115]
MIARLNWLALKVASLFSKVALLLTIAASILWVPTSNFLLEMGCDQRGLCNTAFENFLWIWGVPIAAISIAFALWIIGGRASEAANEVVR